MPKPTVVHARITPVLALLAALACAPSALADATVSSNWSGYVSHRAGVSFRSVYAVWREPSARCRRGHATYSAYWVGLGGYSVSSPALEQTGTEVDCSLSGKVLSSAWWEIFPAPSESITLRVAPGDEMAAGVVISGHRVLLALADMTRHESFRKNVYARVVDGSSAEWIVEAPSQCISPSACQILPLANFGTVTFQAAGAQVGSDGGHAGAISDPLWRFTRIKLQPGGGRRFVVQGGSGTAAGAATASALMLHGTSFKVTFSQVAIQGNPFFAADAGLPGPGYLVHPGP